MAEVVTDDEIIKSLEEEAYECLFSKFRNALREENLILMQSLYEITFEDWNMRKHEKLFDSSLSNTFLKKTSMEGASQKVSLFLKSAKASLKTLEDPNFRLYKDNVHRRSKVSLSKEVVLKIRLYPFEEVNLFEASNIRKMFIATEEEETKFLSTTPLHEICRVGGYPLHCMFHWSNVNINERNGKLRTLLHMAAGGITRHESKYYKKVGGIPLTNCENEDVFSTPQKIKHGFLSFYHSLSKKTSDEESTINCDEDCEKTYEESLLQRYDLLCFLLEQGISINSVDFRNRTALHYAAELGRTKLCIKLVSHIDMLLSIVDVNGCTASELASQSGHSELTATLEAFCLWKEDVDTETLSQLGLDIVHPFSWFRSINLTELNILKESRIQSIQKWLYQSSIELSENNIFKLLDYFNWNEEMVIQKLKESFKETLTEAEICEAVKKNPMNEENDEKCCLICLSSIDEIDEEWITLKNCSHGFCQSCLVGYLESLYEERGIGLLEIKCPNHCCPCLVDPEDIQKINLDLYEKFTLVENELFLGKSHDIRYCPSCDSIVQKLVPKVLQENFGHDCIDFAGAVCCSNTNSACRTYEGLEDEAYKNVDCGRQPNKGHRFCFTCSKEPHWPLECSLLEKWLDRVREEVGDDLEEKTYEDLAADLWLKANTRPCPKCNAPIEKYDGCNHMTCTNRFCRHEFCWVCMKDWKLHSSKTGGYFRCNRWQEEDDDQNVEKKKSVDYGSSTHAARVARSKSKDMARFLHYYSRWVAQMESIALELRMSQNTLTRLTPIINTAIKYGQQLFYQGKDISFIYAAFDELSECRSFLKHSYAFAFFRFKHAKHAETMGFENVLSELEFLTEQLSDVVARQHFRASQNQIMFLTIAAAEKRREMSNFMISIHHTMKQEKAFNSRMNLDSDEEETWTSLQAEASDEWLMLLERTRSLQVAVRDASNQVNNVAINHQNNQYNGSTQRNRPRSQQQKRKRRSQNFAPNNVSNKTTLTDDEDNFSYLRTEKSDYELEQEEQDQDQLRLAVEESIRMHMSFSQPSNSSGSDTEEFNQWECNTCTYINVVRGRRCAMCGTIQIE